MFCHGGGSCLRAYPWRAGNPCSGTRDDCMIGPGHHMPHVRHVAR